MNANDVQVVRVFPCATGSMISNSAFPTGTAYEVHVECEAGSVIHGLGGPYRVDIYVRDLTLPNQIVNQQTANGTLGNANWPNLDVTLLFTIPAATLVQNHVYRLLAVLKVGVVNPDVSFAESPMYVAT